MHDISLLLPNKFSLSNMCLSTWIYTKLFGKLIGKDEFGNSYYESALFARNSKQSNRWVYYKGIAEASKIPATWFRWLHYQTNKPTAIGEIKQKHWVKKHIPNSTGTMRSYHPQYSSFEEKSEVRNYQAWKPKRASL